MFAGHAQNGHPRFGSLLALDSGGTVLLGSTLPLVALVLRLLATYPVSGPNGRRSTART
jgi:hypothetical protein